MIGNDIVDLELAKINSRWNEQRFLDKLFTKEEQIFILKDELRYQNIWRLWSMKESAYKMYSRNAVASVFNPKFFKCTVISDTLGFVQFKDQHVTTTTEYNSKSIYTIAQFSKVNCLTEIHILRGSEKNKSQQLKVKAIEAYAHLKSISSNSIMVKKNKFGIPRFLVNQKTESNGLSLTHHGRYGAFAISF